MHIIQTFKIPTGSVVDPNTLNLDQDPEFWPNLDQDPDQGLYYQTWKKIIKNYFRN